MKYNIRAVFITLMLFLVLPFFQNCGQSSSGANSGLNSESSNSPFPPANSSSGPGGGAVVNIVAKTCTSEPLVFIAGNQYRTNAFGSFTMPVLVTFDTATQSSKVDFPRPHYMYPSTSNPGNGQGLYGYDLSVAYDKLAQPHLIGRESYAVRTQNCNFKSFTWQSLTTFQEVLVSSNSQLSTQNMVPYNIVSTVSVDSQIYSAVNFIGTDDNSACPQTPQTSSANKVLVPALYNHATKAVTFLPTLTSRERVHTLLVVDNKLIASGFTEAGIRIIWKDGQRFEVPLNNLGNSKLDISLGNYFFAGVSELTGVRSLNVSKNGALKNSVPVLSTVTLIDFDADLDNTYSLMKDTTTNRFHYLINETTTVPVDTSSFTICNIVDIKSFNKKVYVFGNCARADNSRSFVVWVDGRLTQMTHTANIQNVSTTRYDVGCNTTDGFFTDLDNNND